MAMDVKHPGWQAFVLQMRNNRADLVTRKVFADWCEDTFGEQSFAKFVRQCCLIAEEFPENTIAPVRGWEAARIPGLHKDWEPYRDCERWLRESWLRWPPLESLPPQIQRQWRFHAGFPDRLVMPFNVWLKEWRNLLAIGPVGAVYLYQNPGCHVYQGYNLTTLAPARMDLIHMCAARKVEFEVRFENHLYRDSRVRFSHGVGERLIEGQAIEIVMNRLWKPPEVSVIYIDEPRGDQPEEYADR